MKDDLHSIRKKLIEAVQNSDLKATTDLVDLWREAEEIKSQTEHILQREEKLKLKLDGLKTPTRPNEFSGRKVSVEVTPGSRGHSYLLVTGPLRKRILSANERLKIFVPATQARFETGIFLRNKVLEERDEIGRFYQEAQVKDWDFVTLEETAPGEWTLTKNSSHES